jgi:hypothetical protein
MTNFFKKVDAFLEGIDLVVKLIILVAAILLFAIYVLPWLEIAFYAIGLLWGVLGVVFLAAMGLIAFVRWNWEL